MNEIERLKQQISVAGSISVPPVQDFSLAVDVQSILDERIVINKMRSFVDFCELSSIETQRRAFDDLCICEPHAVGFIFNLAFELPQSTYHDILVWTFARLAAHRLPAAKRSELLQGMRQVRGVQRENLSRWFAEFAPLHGDYTYSKITMGGCLSDPVIQERMGRYLDLKILDSSTFPLFPSMLSETYGDLPEGGQWGLMWAEGIYSVNEALSALHYEVLEDKIQLTEYILSVGTVGAEWIPKFFNLLYGILTEMPDDLEDPRDINKLAHIIEAANRYRVIRLFDVPKWILQRISHGVRSGLVRGLSSGFIAMFECRESGGGKRAEEALCGAVAARLRGGYNTQLERISHLAQRSSLRAQERELKQAECFALMQEMGLTSADLQLTEESLSGTHPSLYRVINTINQVLREI